MIHPDVVYISVILSPAFVKVKYENPTAVVGVTVTGDVGVSTAIMILISPATPSNRARPVFELVSNCTTDVFPKPAGISVCDGDTVTGFDDNSI